jgi:phage terminase large subunit-like protein
MGVSVSAEFLLEQQQAAKESPRKASVFQTKHMNRWVSGFDAWMNMLWWQRQEDKTLRREDFRGGRSWSAIDLSSKYDITASVSVYMREIEGQRHYYVFGRYYLPRETAEDPESRHYQEWLASGELIATEGDIIDYARIEGDLVEDARQDEMVELAFDPWGATQLAQRLSEDNGITTVEVPQTTRHLSEPMKMVEALTKTGRLHHDGNACLTWMVSNVVAREDANENVFPRKEVPQNKIDGAVAMIMALGRALAEEERDLTAEQVIYV